MTVSVEGQINRGMCISILLNFCNQVSKEYDDNDDHCIFVIIPIYLYICKKMCILICKGILKMPLSLCLELLCTLLCIGNENVCCVVIGSREARSLDIIPTCPQPTCPFINSTPSQYSFHTRRLSV